MHKGGNRFRDPNTMFMDGPAIVACPRCSGPAHANTGSVTCSACGFTRAGNEPNFVAETNLVMHRAWRPRCLGCGKDLPSIVRLGVVNIAKELPVRCNGCGHVGTYPVRVKPELRKANLDPTSGLPYFLTAPVGRNILWVRNLDHLELIEHYVFAQLRERALSRVHMTMLERLPKWIKVASNRGDLLRGIERLRKASKSLAN